MFDSFCAEKKNAAKPVIKVFVVLYLFVELILSIKNCNQTLWNFFVFNIFQNSCFFTFFDVHKHVGLGVCRQLSFYYLSKSELVFCFSILVTRNFVVILFIEEP